VNLIIKFMIQKENFDITLLLAIKPLVMPPNLTV
jgi:hypothetical protein